MCVFTDTCMTHCVAAVTLTLICEVDVDILKVCPLNISEVSRSRLSKVRAQTGKTHRQTDTTKHITMPRSWVIINIFIA